MTFRRSLLVLITFTFFSFLHVSYAICGPPNACGATADTPGSDCAPDQRCVDDIYTRSCKPDPKCLTDDPPTTGYSTCSPTSDGCGGGCGPNRKCVQTNYGWHCQNFTGACVTNQMMECTAPGCGHGCGPGRKCVIVGGSFGNHCVDAGDECGVLTCNTTGCDPDICGPGYRCQNSHCVVDAKCIGTTLDSQYQGPKITSFANLMGRIYNLMFPAAVLFGVIMVIRAGYVLMTSQGNPQLTRAGQEDLTAAVIGTAFVVLSAAILRIIIVQILGGSVGF
jgi:hypothetical protein